MFHKEGSSITTKSSAKKAKEVPLKKSDRKRLLQLVANHLVLSEEDDDDDQAILRAAFLKGTLYARHLIKDGTKVTLYMRSPCETDDDDPWPYRIALQCIWMQIEEEKGSQHGDLQIPGLALLAVLPPNCIPTVTVPSQASKYICRGAHVMRSGMLTLPSSLDTSSPRIVAVRVHGNPQAFCVGQLHPDIQGAADVGVGTKGIGIHVYSAYGDDLWRQQLPTPGTAMSNALVSVHGGAYDAGQYGNVGFCEGKLVVPISVTTTDEGGAIDENIPETKLPGDTSEMAALAEQPSPHESLTEKQGETGSPPVDADSIKQEGEIEDETRPTSPLLVAEEEDGDDKQEQGDVDAPSDKNTVPMQLSPEEVLHAAVCRALVSVKPKQQLPMTVANFYAKHVLTHRPEGTTIELKKTRYKKLGPYIREQVERGLMVVGPDANKKDPMAILISYDKRHEDLREYFAQAKAEPSTDEAAVQAKKLVLVQLYCLPNHFTKLLRLDPDRVKASDATSLERRGTGMLTLKEMRSILDDYLEREELVDSARRNQVYIDGPLTDALYKSKKKEPAQAPPPVILSRKDLTALWQDRMEPAYALVEMPGNRMVKLGYGKPPTVSIEVSRRQSKKFVTHVRGLEAFGIGAGHFAKDVSHRFACSSSVLDESNLEGRPALGKGHAEIVFQGNLVDELKALLLGDESLSSHGGVKGSDYHLPKNSIDVTLRKGVPASKKRGPTKKKR